jgi:hypothetical protein
MSEQLPFRVPDEPAGDMADQAFRLQMAQEQAAIRAALAGDVRGTDAYDDRPATIEPLEGPDVLDADAVEGSDDPLHGGGTPITDPGQATLHDPRDGSLDPELSMTGLAEDGAAIAIEEGGTLEAEDASTLGHDPDDPQDPDGYGVPPAPDGGSAAVDQTELRDPVDDPATG